MIMPGFNFQPSYIFLHAMKTILLTLLIITFWSTSFAINIDDTVYYDAYWYKVKKKHATYFRTPAVKSGKYYIVNYYLADGTPYKTGTYEATRIDYHLSVEDNVAWKYGPFKQYHKNGKLYYEGNYVYNSRDGLWNYYHEDGTTLKATGKYNFDSKVGDWKYYRKDGTLSVEEAYYADVQDLCYVIYYDTLQKKMKEGVSHSEQRIGAWVYYFSDTEAIQNIVHYDSDTAHGKYTYYDRKTGFPIVHGKFNHGRQDSVWTLFNPNTQKAIRQQTFKSGYRNGPFLEYYSSGNIMTVSEYTYGKQSGELKAYYDSPGKLYYEGTYKDAVAQLVFYDSASGYKYSEGQIADNVRYGTWYHYYSNGKLLGEENYKNGVLHGDFFRYSQEGKITQKKHYVAGKTEGTLTYYHEGTGIPWIEVEAKNDTADGKRIFYYPSGKIKRKELLVKGTIAEGKSYGEEGQEKPYEPAKVTKASFGENVMTYIGNNLRYPKDAGNAVEGRVLVGFTVQKSGLVSDVHVIESLEPIYDQEAVRLIAQMPPWKPYEIDGIPLDDYQTLPIVFWNKQE